MGALKIYRCARVACMGLLFVLGIGCVGPILGGAPPELQCGDACDGGAYNCEDGGCSSGVAAWSAIHASWFTVRDQVGVLLPWCSPVVEVPPCDAPPPSLFHAVPTRPVFGGGHSCY